MGFDWEGILDSDDLENAWYDAVYDAGRRTGGWSRTYASTFQVGSVIDEDFCLQDIDQRVSKNGRIYLVLTLKRPSTMDTIKACLFDPEGVLTPEDAGKTAHVRGAVEDHKGYPVLRFHSIALLEEGSKVAVVGTLKEGSTVDGVFVLRKAAVKTASNGKRYLAGVLTDDSGWIALRVWNYTGSLSEKDNGKRVVVKGTVTSFRDMLRVEASQIKLVE